MVRTIVQFKDGYFIKYLVSYKQLKNMFCTKRNCQIKAHILSHGEPVAFFNINYK